MINSSTAAVSAFRNDIRLNFVQITSEVGKFAEDGLDILYANEWLEKPPHVLKHENLVKS
jgi:hypothetical protein